MVYNQNELVNPVNVDDYTWYRWSQDKSILGHTDIFLNGFFQRLDILYPYRDYIKSLFHVDNHEWINSAVRVSDIARNYDEIESPSDDEIVMHVRMGDFIHDQYNAHILHPEYYTQILDKIHTGGKFTIVCDSLKNPTEEEYIRQFDKYSAEFRSTTMIGDFNYIRKAKRIICSNSTYAFMASFLGDPKEIYMAWTNFYKEQALYPFTENCTIIPSRCMNIYDKTVKCYL